MKAIGLEGAGQAPVSTPADVLKAAEAASLRLVRFLYCDNDGLIRGKATGLSGLAERLETGIGLTVAMQAFTVLDRLAPVEGMGPVGEIRLVPDPATFVVAPYAPATGVVLVDMRTLDGQAYPADPRAFLRRMTDRAAGSGLDIVAAFEPEWSLARREGDVWVPIDESTCFSTSGMNTAAGVIDDVVVALEAQGMAVEQYYPELGWGQQELSIRSAPALRAADNHLLYRETVRGVVSRHGLQASFAPKPWPEQAGNGCHLHWSAWTPDRSVNLFHDEHGPWGLSGLARHFLAGVLEHLPALVALTAASVNSYRRLRPQTWASAYRVWGPDNREAAVRVPSTFEAPGDTLPRPAERTGPSEAPGDTLPRPAERTGPSEAPGDTLPTPAERTGRRSRSTNLELKASDSSANPYLALGGLIAAGLDGIERGLEPPPPVLADPAVLGEEERLRAGAARLPESLGQAVANLERDEVLMEALGERLATSYVAVKKLDVEAFSQEDDAFEFRQHFARY